jgi:hypothetical protein
VYLEVALESMVVPFVQDCLNCYSVSGVVIGYLGSSIGGQHFGIALGLVLWLVRQIKDVLMWILVEVGCMHGAAWRSHLVSLVLAL